MDDNEEEQTELREDSETDFINEEDLQEVPVENIPADGRNKNYVFTYLLLPCIKLLFSWGLSANNIYNCRQNIFIPVTTCH